MGLGHHHCTNRMIILKIRMCFLSVVSLDGFEGPIGFVISEHLKSENIYAPIWHWGSQVLRVTLIFLFINILSKVLLWRYLGFCLFMFES